MATAEGAPAPLDRSGQPVSTGPYTLRSLMEDVPLSAEGQETQITITCVEYWGMHITKRLHLYDLIIL